MFRQRRTPSGHLWTRSGVFAFGLLMVFYGTSLFSRGIFVFRNQYRMEVYSPAVAVTGAVFMLLALIPDGLLKWWIKPGEKNEAAELRRNVAQGVSAGSRTTPEPALYGRHAARRA